MLEFYGKTKKRHAIIRNNRNYLENNIQPNDELLASLLSLNCITDEQSQFIQRQRSTRDKNYKLLCIMQSLGDTKFSTFDNCLRRTNQRAVAKIIENGGGLTFKLYLKASLIPYLYSCETACPLWCHLRRLMLRSLQCACLWSLVHSGGDLAQSLGGGTIFRGPE